MLIAATPGDNAGLEFDLCRRNGGCLLQLVGGLDSTCAPLGLLRREVLARCVSRGLGAVRVAAQTSRARFALL